MAVLRNFRSRVRNFVHLPAATKEMGTSILSSTSFSSNSTGGGQQKTRNGEIISGTEGAAKSANASIRPTAEHTKRPPRFFFWTLSLGNEKKKGGSKNNSLDSSPRTPDSSRSVSFEDSDSWPFIDDEIENGMGNGSQESLMVVGGNDE